MKKILLLPVLLVLLFEQSKLDASVQTYCLNPITSLSFEVNGSPVSVDPGFIQSIIGLWRAGDVATFTVATAAPEAGPVVPGAPPAYALFLSSPVWGSMKHLVLSSASWVTSCSLNVEGLDPIAMPIADGGTISVKVMTSTMPYQPISVPATATNVNLYRIPALGNHFCEIASMSFTDVAGQTYPVGAAQVAALNAQYQQLAQGGIGMSIRIKNNNFIALFAGQAPYPILPNVTNLGFPITVSINNVAVATIGAPLAQNNPNGPLLCALQK